MKRLIVGFVIACSIIAPRPCNADWNSVGQGLLAAGGLLCGVGAACAAYSWFGAPSNETILEQTDTMIATMKKRYKPVCDIVELAYDDSLGRMERPLEHVLYDVAIALWDQKALKYVIGSEGTVVYGFDITQDVALLRKQQATLYKAIQSIYEDSSKPYDNAADKSLVLAMEKALKHIKRTIDHVTFFAKHFEQHRAYFDLCAVEWACHAHYRDHIDLVTAGYDVSVLIANIRKMSSSSYPIIQYVFALKRDMKHLQNNIMRTSSFYSERRAWAQGLLNNLALLHSVLSPEHDKEVLRQSWDELEREKLRLKREQNNLKKIALVQEQQRLLDCACAREDSTGPSVIVIG
jgi:hypothetical protein